jgi:hypothetical protein
MTKKGKMTRLDMRGGTGQLLVLPAASRPSMRIRISLFAKSLLMILLMEPPMVM